MVTCFMIRKTIDPHKILTTKGVRVEQLVRLQYQGIHKSFDIRTKTALFVYPIIQQL